MTEGELEMIREAVQLLPKGWCIVPVEPTSEMKIAGAHVHDQRPSEVTAIYTAMLANAPNRKREDPCT